MERTVFMRKYIDLVRYDRPYNSLPCILITIIGIIGALNSLMVILTEQESFEKRVLGVKEFLTITLIISNSLELALKPHKNTRLMELIEDEFLVNRIEFFRRDEKWKQFETYYNETKIQMEKTSKNIFAVFVVAYLGFINKSLFNELLRYSIGLERNSIDLPAPYAYWSPTHVNQFEFFVYIYIFQSLMIFIYTIETYCIQISVSLATERLLADFGTIFILIEHLSKDFPEFEITDRIRHETHQQDNENYNVRAQHENLKRDMSRIVRCHQRLIRNFKDCETNAGYAIIVISLVIFTNSCVDFFIILKGDNLMTKINYGVSCILINLVILYPYNTGQRIANQNEILRQSLTNLPWIDKPRWFKKTLQIMMIRVNVDIVMNPYGLHYLNYMSFKNIIKTSYTFGNFLFQTALN
ncbi:uncharacterized protein LOC120353248 [Nilaparvata lugens]|uniref:uncharacterized protein LOC120353248 n=1 Tax=Nilaparvata lugens TaxID=108931 RepID=UPI00193DC4F3|nr:uncharacterized protein LOC120353248 [Nilaparvata lugens]